MVIRSMSDASIEALLQRSSLGHLACCLDRQPYVVPISFTYRNGAFYSCGTLGRKIEWMRRNPLVCIEVADVVNRQQWQTVVAFGRYEELLETPDFLDDRIAAHEHLATRPNWWEPAFARTIEEGGERPVRPLFFRIAATQMVGHCAEAG